MLLPSAGGYKVLLKKASSPGEEVRQRFSFAHELGHLLLRKLDYDGISGPGTKHRSRGGRDKEERLCDMIAVEILLPRAAFIADASAAGWSLHGIRRLRQIYRASVPATASRLLNMSPEACHMGIWRPADTVTDAHQICFSRGRTARYGIPSPAKISRRRLWLISRAAKSSDVEIGISPLTDRARPTAYPNDVSAEAWAWGKDEHRRVLLFYYPERELTEGMLTLSNATRRPL